MRTSAVSGLIFANANDNMLKKLTANRSMASVPFGARYRIIDFALSNLVNAGVMSVGIITKENYRSLMDHVGSGISWDLDRKNGGLYIIPPYHKSGVKRYMGSVSAMYGAMDYIERCAGEYMVLYNSHAIANIDISKAFKQHIAKKADVTMIYHNGVLPKYYDEKMVLTLDENQKVSDIYFGEKKGEVSFGLGVTIIKKDLLIKLVKEAYEDDLVSFARDVLANKIKSLNIYGFLHDEFVAVMDNTATYYESSMALLKKEVRNQLFNKKRPIYTKARDGMPTKYGTKAKVKNSILGDDCVIEGEVKNSILFRGVKVEKGAVVENCILMQETVVGKDAQLFNVISDKNASISDEMVLKGTETRYCFVEKNHKF